MSDDEIKNLVDINSRISFLIGMASVLIDKMYKHADASDKEKCKKFFNEINKLYYDEK